MVTSFFWFIVLFFHLHSLQWFVSLSFFKSLLSSLPSHLTLLLPACTFQGPYDYISSTRIIYNNIPILWSITLTSSAKFLLTIYCNIFIVPRIWMWTSLKGHCSANHNKYKYYIFFVDAMSIGRANQSLVQCPLNPG